MNASITSRLTALRQAMQQQGVSACVVALADPHLSEYLAPRWQVLPWLCGFTGSAGTLIITLNHAVLWTDSRYFMQAQHQLQDTGVTLMKLGLPGTPDYLAWLEQQLSYGDNVTIAGDSVSLNTQRQMETRLRKVGVCVRTDLDLPALIWLDRPALPRNPVNEHPIGYACISRTDKLSRLRDAMHQHGASHHLVSSLDDIAWLVNLRGSDIPYNPVFLAHLLVSASQVTLFTDRNRLSDNLVATLTADGIALADYATINTALGQLPPTGSLLFDPDRVVSAIASAIAPKMRRIEAVNPSAAFKAVRTPGQLVHIREVMRRDGAALVHAFNQIERRLSEGEPLTELDVDHIVRAARRAQPDFIGESFPTIAGYQANGAMPHYCATQATHSRLQAKGLLLVDSGGQYLGGTTDITRMLALGPLSDEQKRDATLVLKGMIALSRARFPHGTSGMQLDALARMPLWASGMDYGHGTGHGVGYFLNVHEGPQSIRKPLSTSAIVALEPGMMTSIEPGLYKPGCYGIRHENLVVVKEAIHTRFGDYHTFETLTLCPFDRGVLDLSLLDPDECDWLNDYHASVYDALQPLLEGTDLIWLKRHCAPLATHMAAQQYTVV